MKFKFGSTSLARRRGANRRADRPRGHSMAIAGIASGLLLLSLISVYLIIFAPILLLLLAAAAAAIGSLGAGVYWARKKGAGDGFLAFNLFLLWALCINVPTYTHFDQRGIEQLDIINGQSIGRLFVTFVVAFGYAIGTLVMRRSKSSGKPAISFSSLWIPIALYGWYSFEAVMILKGKDALLALFRAFEWFLLIALIVRVINRFVDSYVQKPDAGAEEIVTGKPAGVFALGMPLVAFPVGLAVVMALTVPWIAFSTTESGAHRLQTPFTHSNVLGVLAGMLFFYALENFKRWRYSVAFLSFAVIIATYSRGSWVGFLFAFVAWILLKSKPGIPRALSGVLLALIVLFGVVGRHQIVDAAAVVLSRNSKNPEDIQSASERTLVWQYAGQMIRAQPWLGYGYVVGPKQLGDLMASGISGSYFRARHAHNDVIQAEVSGGIAATILTLALYAHLVWMCLSLCAGPLERLGRCSLTWTILAFAYGMLTPLVNERSMPPGTVLMFLYCWVIFVRRQVKAEERIRNPRLNLFRSKMQALRPTV